MLERAKPNLSCRLIGTVLFVLLLGTVGNTFAAPREFAFVGEFSNVRHTSNHAYGYSVQLWREDGKLFGFLTDATGLSGDTPIGLLEDVHFDPVRGALSFTAKLSIQSVYLSKGKLEPTHDFFVFTGTLQKEILSGTLTHVDKSQSDQEPETKRVRLVKTESRTPIDAATHVEWKESVDRILKFRGPKW